MSCMQNTIGSVSEAGDFGLDLCGYVIMAMDFLRKGF